MFNAGETYLWINKGSNKHPHLIVRSDNIEYDWKDTVTNHISRNILKEEMIKEYRNGNIKFIRKDIICS